MKLVKAIVHQARRHEQDPAVVFGGGVANFGALMGATAAVAEAIGLLGLPGGSLVVLDIRNPIHHLAAMYALALLGIRSASVGTMQVTAHSGPRPALFLTDRQDIPVSDIPTRVVDGRWFAYDASQPVAYAALLALPGFPNPDDVVRYVYSSGTTGRPKCVALTNRVLELRIANYMLTTSARFRGPVLNMMGFSTILGTNMPLFNHAQGWLTCHAASSAEAVQLTRMFGITAVAGSITQVKGFMEAMGDGPPPASLATVAVAGSRLPHPLLTQFRARLASHVIGGYGSTEMGRLAVASPADLERAEGAAGHVLPWVTIEIVDDNGRPVPRGQDGVVRVRSEEQASYADATGQLTETTDDGWFYPGDIGRIEPDGLVIITGRTGEVINRGGVVVAPEVIEEVLRLDPQIVDVAVVGVPTPAGIDQIWAGIVPRSPLEGERIIRTARLKLNERIPDRLFEIAEIPRSANGKVMRNVLRDQLRAMITD